MQASDSENFQQLVINHLDKLSEDFGALRTDVNALKTDVDSLRGDVDSLRNDVEKLDYKFDTYQGASDQRVRLTTTIIVAAASVVILSPMLQAIAPAINALLNSLTASAQ